jgi:hypothetical protein
VKGNLTAAASPLMKPPLALPQIGEGKNEIWKTARDES